MIKIRLLATLVAFSPLGSALAASYPVSGQWAYDRSASREEVCRSGPFMEFNGNRRLDNGGGAPDYRNLSISRSGPSLYRITDLFFTGAIRGQMIYTLRLVDAEHIEIKPAMGGKLIKLRRCA
jgi:hypothetical protein